MIAIARIVGKEFLLTQEELRESYKERLVREKQSYIAKTIGIDAGLLSKFKTGKIDLYPHLFEKLKAYLTETN